jgi:enamine deaminase RidA (YjgF/YER057c/UK114 family)
MKTLHSTAAALAATLAVASSGAQAAPSPLLRAINPPGAASPGISQAVAVEGGRLVFLSGHVPMAQDGTVPPGLEAQLEQVFAHLDATLRAAGATARDLARITLYVRGFHPDQLPAIRSARDRFIGAAPAPASALIGVAALFHPDVLVEVDAVAVLPPAP